MKGGFNNPPNEKLVEYIKGPFVASMKGGFNNPPTLRVVPSTIAGSFLQ